MRLLYNALFGIILLIFSIILSIPAIQFIFSLKNDYIKSDTEKLTKVINSLEPFGYQEVILNFKENDILLYNPIHRGFFFNNLPLNYKEWRDYFSYSCDDKINYKNQDGIYYLHLDNPQFKCFYNFNGLSIKEEFKKLLENIGNDCVLGESINLYSDLFVSNYVVYKSLNSLSNILCIGSDVYLKYKLYRLSLTLIGSSFRLARGSFGYSKFFLSMSKQLTKEESKKILYDSLKLLSERIKKNVLESISSFLYKSLLRITITAFSRVSTASFVPAIGQVLDIALLIWSGYDIYKLISEIKEKLDNLDNLERAVLGIFDNNVLEYKLRFFQIDDLAALDVYQNYLFSGELKNGVVNVNSREKVDDSIYYITGYTTLVFPQYFENAFLIKDHFNNKVFVVKLPFSKDNYLVFLLNETEFKELLPYLNLIKERKFLELSDAYVINLLQGSNGKIYAYLNFKLFKNGKKSNFDLFSQYLTIYLPNFRIYNEKEILEGLNKYNNVYLFRRFVIFDNTSNIDYALLMKKFEECVRDNEYYFRQIFNNYLSLNDNYPYLTLYGIFKMFSYFYLTSENKSCKYLFDKVNKKIEALKKVTKKIKNSLNSVQKEEEFRNLLTIYNFLDKINLICNGVNVDSYTLSYIKKFDSESELNNYLIDYFSKFKCNSNLDSYFKAVFVDKKAKLTKSSKYFLEQLLAFKKFDKLLDNYFLTVEDTSVLEEMANNLLALLKENDNPKEYKENLIKNSIFGKKLGYIIDMYNLRNEKENNELFKGLNLH